MSAPRPPGFHTLALHAGSAPDPATGARATPIHFTAGFAFRSAEHGAALCNMEQSGHIHSRLSNPTCAVLEERMASLEGGVAAIATASGAAALHLAISTLAGAGDHLVASSDLDPGSYHLLAHTLPRFGIDTTFVHPRDSDAWRAAIRPNTKMLLGESIGSCALAVLDIAAIAAVAHEHDLPLLVDATFASPWLQRPLDLGADLVLHSATEFLSGHGTAVGGVLIDGGTFDWQAAHDRSERFATLCAPCDGFHGLVFAEESSVAAFALRARAEGLGAFGAAMSPHNAFAILQGIDTLGLRMRQHVANTRQIAEFLLSQAAVRQVNYPGLENHPDFLLAQRMLPRGAGAVLTFALEGDLATVRRFADSLRLFTQMTSVGEARSSLTHPASTTHRGLPGAALDAAGVSATTLRLSVGLEDPLDLIDELKRAFKIAAKGA